MDRKIELSPEARKKVMQYQQCFNGPGGQEVLKDLEAYVQFWFNSFVKREGEVPSGEEMAFLEGRKAVYRHIKNILNVDLPKG